MTSQTVDDYLSRFGWTFLRNGLGTWVTGFQGDHRSYPLVIELCDTYISLKVVPLMKLKIEWDHWPELLRYLLELNDRSQIVKIHLDEFGDLGLSAQVLCQKLDYEHFSDHLNIVGYYADRIYDDLVTYMSMLGFDWNKAPKFLS